MVAELDGEQGAQEMRDDPPDPKDMRAEYIRKIRELLDKTLNEDASEEDREAARAQAQRLMALHKITEDDLASDPNAVESETWETIKQKWVYVERQEVFVCTEFDADGELGMMSVSAFDRAFKYVMRKSRLGKGKLSDYIFNQPPGFGLRRFKTFAYAPGKGEDYDGALNMWRPSDIVPKEGPEGCNKWFHDHLAYLFKDKADREHVLNWCAWVYKHQDLHPHHALLIHGLKTGTGKSLIKNLMGRLLGVTNLTELGPKLLDNDFEKWKIRTKLASVEEVRPGFGTSNSVLKNLHDLISEDRMPVNIKNKDDFQMRNVLAVIGGSNKDNALHIEDSERRWLIVSTDRVGGVLQPMPNAYYRSLYGRDGVGGMLNDSDALAYLAYGLLNRNLGEYSAGERAPDTAAKQRMAEASADELERHIVENRDDPPWCYSLATMDEMLEAVPDDIRRRAKDPRQSIGDVIKRKLKGENLGKVRLGGRSDRRPRMWALNRPNESKSIREAFKDAKLAEMYDREHWKPTPQQIREMEMAGREAADTFARLDRGETVRL
jgi:Family of unknown function (DUF5906)